MVSDQIEGTPFIAFPEPGNDAEQDGKRKHKKLTLTHYQGESGYPEMNEQLCLQDSGVRSHDQHQLLIHAQGTVNNAPPPPRKGFPLVKSGGIVCLRYNYVCICCAALYQFRPLYSNVEVDYPHFCRFPRILYFIFHDHLQAM